MIAKLIPGLAALALAAVVNAPAAGQFTECEWPDDSACELLYESRGIRVIDGDSFLADSEKIQLWGIEAPNVGRMCPNVAGVPYDMGEMSAMALVGIMALAFNHCERVGTDEDGHAVARCYMHDGRDLGRYQVQMGLAWDVPEVSGGEYASDEAAARERSFGTIWEWDCDPPLGPGSQD